MGCSPRAVDCCVTGGYRKCAVMATIGIADMCRSYDEYGCGIRGIASYAMKHGYDGIILWQSNCDGYGIVSSNGDKLPVFYYGDASASSHAAAAKFACDVLGMVPAEVAAAIAFYAMRNSVVTNEWARLAKEALERTLREAGDGRLMLSHKRLDAIYGGDEGSRKREAAKLLDMEGMVKKYIVVGRRKAAANMMANMLALLLPSMDEEALKKYLRSLDILGAALTVLHAAAISLLVPETLRSPEDVDEAIAALDGSDTNVVLVVKLVKKYLEAVRELRGYYAGADRNAQYAKLHGASAFLKIGGASGHHAHVKVRGSKLIIEYSDHASRRIEALASFLRKIGVDVTVSDGGLTAEVPSEKIEDVAVVLATLPSVDIYGCYNIYEDASDVEDLVRLRKRCGGDDDYYDEEEDC